MLTADKVRQLTTLCNKGLARLLADSGYTGCSFESAEFLGISNGGQFVYSVKFWDDGGGPEEELTTEKVYVNYNKEKGQIEAEF